MIRVFVSGGTGYIGQRLTRLLVERGHAVAALVRSGSEHKLPKGVTPVIGDVLDGASFTKRIPPSDTFVHLAGVSHPSPWKEREFRRVDLASVKASVAAATSNRILNIVYVSVAQPAPIMKAYLRVRAECEALLAESGLDANILRPWYVLGPGHWWPLSLVPMYRLFENIPSTRETATRLGLVTIREMVCALAWAIENPASGQRIISVPEIRATAARWIRERDAGAATASTGRA